MKQYELRYEQQQQQQKARYEMNNGNESIAILYSSDEINEMREC